jgi:hypothetical protein
MNKNLKECGSTSPPGLHSTPWWALLDPKQRTQSSPPRVLFYRRLRHSNLCYLKPSAWHFAKAPGKLIQMASWSNDIFQSRKMSGGRTRKRLADRGLAHGKNLRLHCYYVSRASAEAFLYSVTHSSCDKWQEYCQLVMRSHWAEYYEHSDDRWREPETK